MNEPRMERTPEAAAETVFNAGERHALQTIQQRYHPGQEYFTSNEPAHLRSVCWLRDTGRSSC